MNDLIDTVEMYLRTVLEIEEEGDVPLRVRISERLDQKGPTVSETVGRMERDHLVVLTADRRLALTERGRRSAVSVMRKHRVAERLMWDVIGVDWEHVHREACRLEHVISDEVERRVLELLDHPTTSPFGNPIPGLDRLGLPVHDHPTTEPVSLNEQAARGGGVVQVNWIAENIQAIPEILIDLRECNIIPGAFVEITGNGADQNIVIATDTTQASSSTTILDGVYCTPVALV